MNFEVEFAKYRELIIQYTSDKGLVDAHRHSLYDVGSIEGIKGLSVDQWHDAPSFIHFQNKNKNLYGNYLHDKIIDWLRYSINEGVKTILDFSAKHARKDLNAIYSQYGVNSFAPIKWNDHDYLNYLNSSNKCLLKPKFVILPDERMVNIDILNHAKELLKVFPGMKFTMHCMESEDRKKLAVAKFGCSTIEWLSFNEFLTDKIYLVHVNECSLNDFKLIREHEANIVICPLMRKPLKYNSPEIPTDLSIYFGTDAPIISNNRSLIDAAIIQVNEWIKFGVDQQEAVMTASKALVNRI